MSLPSSIEGNCTYRDVSDAIILEVSLTVRVTSGWVTWMNCWLATDLWKELVLKYWRNMHRRYIGKMFPLRLSLSLLSWGSIILSSCENASLVIPNVLLKSIGRMSKGFWSLNLGRGSSQGPYLISFSSSSWMKLRWSLIILVEVRYMEQFLWQWHGGKIFC